MSAGSETAVTRAERNALPVAPAKRAMELSPKANPFGEGELPESAPFRRRAGESWRFYNSSGSSREKRSCKAGRVKRAR